MADEEGCHHHFLVLAYGVQSHVNPGRVLARRRAQLDSVDASITVMLCVPVVTAHVPFVTGRRAGDGGGDHTDDGFISYVPYSDGLDDGSSSWLKNDLDMTRWSRARDRRQPLRRPVTCIACTMVSLLVLDVARERRVPLAVYWLQPATVPAASYHFFHGLDELVAAHATDPAHEVRVPVLRRPLRIGSFPSFLTDTSGTDRARAFIDVFRELFEFMDQWRPKVLVNTFDELEAEAARSRRASRR